MHHRQRITRSTAEHGPTALRAVGMALGQEWCAAVDRDGVCVSCVVVEGAAAPPNVVTGPPPLGGGDGRDVLERGGRAGWGPPSSQGPPMVPEGGPRVSKLQSSWHRRRRSKILAVSLKHWKGRGGGGGAGGGTPPPPTVYGCSNTSLGERGTVMK